MQSFVKHIREVAAKDRQLADDAFHKEGMTRREGFHAGAAAALGAVADELEDKLGAVLRAFNGAFIEVATARARAELEGNWAAVRLLMGMQAMVGLSEGLVNGELDAVDFLRRVRAVVEEAEQYRPRG